MVPTLDSVMALISKEAWTCLSKARKGTWEFEDLQHEGVLQYYEAQKTFIPSKSKFSTYLVFALRCHFCSIVSKSFDRDPRTIDFDMSKLPSSDKQRSGIEEVLDIKQRLSDEARIFIDCIFAPPPELVDFIEKKRQSRKAWKNRVGAFICEWLGWSKDDFNRMAEELRNKVEYHPILH